ncbi:hypothetical protein NFI96_006386 [Prochilodus magdalenae]|nr:hypothetical protein NFI96_006386 [Prochilodus magdalenae]
MDISNCSQMLQSERVLVVANRPHEGGLRARRPVVGPVLTGQHRRARLAFATEHQNWQIRHRRLVLFTDESRFYLSTCDRLDRLWRRRGECYAACNISPHDWFGGGSVMVWEGISLEGRTDLYKLDNDTLTAIRYQDEILGPVFRLYTDAVGPGFLLVHNNARPHVARLRWQFLENEGIDTIDWPTSSPDLNPIEHLWDIMFRSIRRHQVALQTVQELTKALLQIWEEIPQDTIRYICRKVYGRGHVSAFSGSAVKSLTLLQHYSSLWGKSSRSTGAKLGVKRQAQRSDHVQKDHAGRECDEKSIYVDKQYFSTTQSGQLLISPCSLSAQEKQEGAAGAPAAPLTCGSDMRQQRSSGDTIALSCRPWPPDRKLLMDRNVFPEKCSLHMRS